jgi:hypothetical protein
MTMGSIGGNEPDVATGRGIDGSDQGDMREEARLWRRMETAFARNPAALVAAMLRNLEPRDAQALVRELPARADVPDFGEEDLLSPAELFLRDEVAPFLPVVRNLPRFQEDVGEAVAQHAVFIKDLLYQNAILQEQVGALLEHTDLDLPEVGRAEIDAALQGRAGYQAAVRAIYRMRLRAAGRPGKPDGMAATAETA